MVSVRSENTSQQNWDIFGVFVVAVTFLFCFFPITPFFVKSVRPFSFSPVCRKPKTTKGKERFTLCLSEKSEVKGGIKSFWCSHWDFPNRKLFVFRGSKIGTSSYFFLVVGSCNCSFKASAVKRTSSNYLKKKKGLKEAYEVSFLFLPGSLLSWQIANLIAEKNEKDRILFSSTIFWHWLLLRLENRSFIELSKALISTYCHWKSLLNFILFFPSYTGKIILCRWCS